MSESEVGVGAYFYAQYSETRRYINLRFFIQQIISAGLVTKIDNGKVFAEILSLKLPPSAGNGLEDILSNPNSELLHVQEQEIYPTKFNFKNSFDKFALLKGIAGCGYLELVRQNKGREAISAALNFYYSMIGAGNPEENIETAVTDVRSGTGVSKAIDEAKLLKKIKEEKGLEEYCKAYATIYFLKSVAPKILENQKSQN